MLSAITWGSESQAFHNVAGGLHRLQWQRLQYDDKIKLEPAPEAIVKLASRSSINFAGYVNRVNTGLVEQDKSVKLAVAGLHNEAEAARISAQAAAKEQLAFLDLVAVDLSKMEEIVNKDAAGHITYMGRLERSTLFAIPLLGILGLLTIVGVSILFIKKFIVNPLKSLQSSFLQLSNSNISSVPSVVAVGPLSGVLRNYNAVLGDMQKTNQTLGKESSLKAAELQSKAQSYEQTQRAMINVLQDARNLEEELKQEKANVEKKVIERTTELRAEQTRLAASVNSLSAGFIMTDDKNNVILINPIAKRILFNTAGEGKESDETITFAKIQGDLHDQIDFSAKVDECLQTKKTVEVTDLLFGGRFLHIYFTPIIDAKYAIGTVILLQDETEEKVMQRSKEEFFSIASHELRTPLTAIRGNTTMIQQYYPEVLKNPELKEMVDDIHNSSVRLIEIVNDFLDASRLEQGKVEFKKERFNIDKIIESVVYEMAGVSKEKGVYVKASNDLGVLPEVYADQDKVKQVIYNLVGNAMKFTEKGGITITANPEKDLLKIYIEDTGRGIPADKQSLLFHKFQQAGESLYTRDTTRGTGLGLYISKLLTESMGGKIALEHSEEGKGTTFSFSLPLASAAEENDSAEEPKKSEEEDNDKQEKSKKP